MPRRVRSVLTFAAMAGGAALLVSGCAGGGAPAGGAEARFAVHAPVPASGAGSYKGDTPTAQLVDPEWLDTVAEATGIPRRALQGYAGAALAEEEVRPDCNVGWNTLAGVGWVESHHGTIFGGSIQENGVTSDLIIGVPLDGDGFQEIADTDAGAVDGDTEWDRAVGPMQIVPATWAAWATEANFDGVPDIHNIDDAALSAAEYLCYSGGDLGSEEGWRAAITGYNESPAYLDEVLEYANRYAAEAEDASATTG
ncbi:MAG: hypothetical protein Q7T71_14405 [Herbiconiux sp.]|nr:hypothetical protein [Herbiconiux sp.]